MAGIIPQNREQVRMNVSSPVPIASAESMRDSGQAMARFGNTLQDVGNQINREYQKLDNIDRQTKLMEGKNELKNAKVLAAKKAEGEAAPDGSDLAAKYAEHNREASAEIMNRFRDDPEAYKQLEATNNMYDSDINTDLALKSVARKEETLYKRLDGVSTSAADRVRENPNEALAGAELRQFNAEIDEIVAKNPEFANNAQKIKAANAERLASMYIEGLGNKEQYGTIVKSLSATQAGPEDFTDVDPDTAQKLGFITGPEAKSLQEKGEFHKIPTLTKKDKTPLSPEMTALMNAVSPEKKAQFLDRARAKAKEKAELRLSDLSAQVSGLEKIATIPGQKITDQNIAALKNNVNKNPNLPLAAKVRTMARIDAAVATNKTLELATSLPPSKFGQVIASFDEKLKLQGAESAKIDPRMAADNDFSVQATRVEARENLIKGLSQIMNQQKDDAANFVLQTDEQMEMMRKGTLDGNPAAKQMYFREMDNKQKYLGVGSENRRLITKTENFNLAQRLRAAQTSVGANQEIQKMQVEYGEYFPRVMQEIARDNKDLEGYQTAIYANENTRSSLLDAIRNEDSINKSFQLDPHHATQQTYIKTAVRDAMADFRKSTLGAATDSGTVKTMNAFENAMDLQIKRDYVKNPSANISDLAEKAYKDIIGSQYETISAANATALVPKQIGGRPLGDSDVKKIKTFIETSMDGNAFIEMGVRAPNGKYKDDPIKYQNDILPARAKWVTNSDQSGLRLMSVTDDGELITVYNRYNKPVEASYEDIVERPPQRVKNQMENYLGPMLWEIFSNPMGVKK